MVKGDHLVLRCRRVFFVCAARVQFRLELFREVQYFFDPPGRRRPFGEDDEHPGEGDDGV